MAISNRLTVHEELFRRKSTVYIISFLRCMILSDSTLFFQVFLSISVYLDRSDSALFFQVFLSISVYVYSGVNPFNMGGDTIRKNSTFTKTDHVSDVIVFKSTEHHSIQFNKLQYDII